MKLVVQSFLYFAIQHVFHRWSFAILARDFLIMQFKRVQAIHVHRHALGGNFLLDKGVLIAPFSYIPWYVLRHNQLI